MFQFGACPRCQSELSGDRMAFQPLICNHCGFTANAVQSKAEQQFERRFLKVGLAIALALGLGFVQAANWDEYALEIIPLKIKELTGTASASDLSRIADICVARLKHDCVESAYAAKGSAGDNEAFAALGKYQIRRGKTREAQKTFTAYFRNGGRDLESAYQFAKVLGETGQIDASAGYFESVLKAKPETLQITVIQNYVKMLVANGRAAQALMLIEETRKSSSTASLFMDTEYQSLKLSRAAIR